MTTTRRQRRPRGSIRRNGSGYQARVYAGLDPLTKNEIYLYEQAPTRADAEKARTRLLSQVDEQRQPKSKITVGEAIDPWLAVARLEEVTRERYESAVRIYLRPVLGDVQAAKASPTGCGALLCPPGALPRPVRGQAERQDRSGDRLPAPVQAAVQRLAAQAALHPATGHGAGLPLGYLTRNPMELVEAPPEDEPEPDPPSDAEVASLLNHAWQRDPDWGTLLFLVTVTGCRRGELCGLRWMNIDLDAGCCPFDAPRTSATG